MNSRQPISEPAARRVYRSTLRAEQAGETRRRLLTAAGSCFAERGYAGTSLKAIAQRAGVSVETVQLNGPKSELLLAAYEQLFIGEEGRRSLLERESVQPLLEMTDPPTMIAGMVDFLASANAQSAALAAASGTTVRRRLRRVAGRTSRRRGRRPAWSPLARPREPVRPAL